MENEVKSPCAICASQGNGACCKRACIPVTLGDMHRIAVYLKKADFWDYRESYRTLDDSDPVWNMLMTTKGETRLLNVRDDGHCCMLDDSTGCVLPMGVRPLVCRLYPYNNFNEEGLEEKPDPLDSDCPIEFSDSGANLAEVIGVSREQAEQWHEELYKELNEEMELFLFGVNELLDDC